METVAVIDIGSNAIRTLVAKIDHTGKFIILKKLRSSIRLGEDVFNHGLIGEEKRNRILKTFLEIKDVLVEFQVVRVKACATSAMREATNGLSIKQEIEELTNIKIDLIDGDLEAKLIHDAVQSELHLDKKLTILVDLGGGSTEFTISQNEKLIACKSFNIGSVRLLKHSDQFSLSNSIMSQLSEVKQFIESVIGQNQVEALVGTGGNFRRLGKVSKKLSPKTFSNYMTLDEVQTAYAELNKLTHNERVKKFDLSDDRADVIVPAAFLIKNIIYMLNVSGIYIPKVGLKEGILLSLINNT